MAQRTIATPLRGDRDELAAIALSPFVIRFAGALLALAVTAAHVADQGGVTVFTAPDWLGWAYRLIEVGCVFVAVVLLWRRSGRLGWAAAVLLGVGPFAGYLASRTVGVPGDPGDVGNWADWVGTLALIVEAALLTLGLGMLWARRALSVSQVDQRTGNVALVSPSAAHSGDAQWATRWEPAGRVPAVAESSGASVNVSDVTPTPIPW
jgi:hypothetical protein